MSKLIINFNPLNAKTIYIYARAYPHLSAKTIIIYMSRVERLPKYRLFIFIA